MSSGLEILGRVLYGEKHPQLPLTLLELKGPQYLAELELLAEVLKP